MVQVGLVAGSVVAASTTLQEFVSVPLPILWSRDYGLAIAVGVIWIVTLAAGGYLGIVRQLFSHIDTILARFLEIDKKKADSDNFCQSP